jgi:hypothetical protein
VHIFSYVIILLHTTHIAAVVLHSPIAAVVLHSPIAAAALYSPIAVVVWYSHLFLNGCTLRKRRTVYI